MPNIPINIAETAEKMDIGKDVWGQTITEEEVKYCSISKSTAFVIVHEYENDSAEPVVIQNIDGSRRVGSVKCTHLLTRYPYSMEIGAISTSFSLSDNKKLSSLGVNSNLRLILITKKKGGQWSKNQMQAMYAKNPKLDD